jgi:hypothetical protein
LHVSLPEFGNRRTEALLHLTDHATLSSADENWDNKLFDPFQLGR